MENKYYIDENGLITLVQSISNSIISHTSGEIQFTEVENPETHEVEKVLQNPNNFPTVKAVTDYLKERDNLKVVYDINSTISNKSYTTTEQVKTYNGEEEVQVDLKLATAEDINNLFN